MKKKHVVHKIAQSNFLSYSRKKKVPSYQNNQLNFEPFVVSMHETEKR
jgi:hypothetical protein